MTNELRMLMVEDSEDDMLLVEHELRRGGYRPLIERVETEEEMREALASRDWDVIISDFVLPGFGGMEALRVLKESDKDLPFIIVSGKIGEETAVSAMKEGAHDYIMKDNLTRLNSAIEREVKEAEVRFIVKEAREELERSNEELSRKTAELSEVNERLRAEASERLRAQEEVLRSKDRLKSVIDSAAEIIISFDENGRVSTWNRTVEELSGYTQKEVLNRSLDKLEAFDNPQEIKEIIDTARSRGKSVGEEFTLRTKTGAKKIISASASMISPGRKGEGGVMFIGSDITPDMEAHGRLIGGLSYLVLDKDPASATDLFSDLVRSGFRGLYVVRSNPEMVRSSIPLGEEVRVMLLRQEGVDGFDTVGDLESMVEEISRFANGSGTKVILLDATHYLITRFSFHEFMEAVFTINDIVSRSGAILLLRVDPEVLDGQHLAIIQNEVHLLPSQRIEDIIIRDESYDLLKYIHDQNSNNVMVSVKKIMSKFKISYVTVARRLDSMEEKGLLYTKRQGKLRTVYISDKGKALLHKRQAV